MSGIAAALMSSVRDDWCTPANVLRLVRQLGPIALDPCGSAAAIVHAVREYRIARGEDGLLLPWSIGGLVFVNPPYGRSIAPWARRIGAEGRAGVEVVALLPARTDTAWFQADIAPGAHLCFWRGRLTFLGAPDPAPFPSVLAYYGGRRAKFVRVFAPHGWIP